MSRIINGGRSDKHIIKEYKFKDFDSSFEDIESKQEEITQSQSTPQPIQQPPPPNDNQNEVIENLLLKIEELSKNIAAAQQKFDAQIAECNARVEAEKKNAFENGYRQGLEEGKKECEAQIQEKLSLLEESIAKIDKINEIFEEKILSVEKELISVALDIAKEVIQKEISKESSEIAYNLAKALMEDIKEASKIKLKVNPKDAEYLKDKFKNVEIIPDSAIKEGGVVIISDLGNIDGEVMERFKNIKEAILEGKE